MPDETEPARADDHLAGDNFAGELDDLVDDELAPHAVVFIDLAGMPGWGSEPGPGDADTSTILTRHASPVSGRIRLVQGCTALVSFPDPAGAVEFALELLAEAARTSGSAVAGAELVDPSDESVPNSRSARVAEALARMADADRVLVTGELAAFLRDRERTRLAFDPGPHDTVDGRRLAAFAVRRR